ncbi:MAG: helix-hairpin-helix domain-containing protein [Micrococcales bacterium]
MLRLRELYAKHWSPIHPRLRIGILALVGGLLAAVVAFASLPAQQNQVSFQSQNQELGWAPSNSATSDASLPPLTNLDATIFVHVVGQVVNPGIYELEPGARVIDAVAAAKGFTAKAAQESVNLARPVTDGEQIQVQARGQVSLSGSSAPSKISLNTATAQQLETLPGIGPALAGRIVDYRNNNGGFQALADLAKVSGLGPKLIAGIKDLVTL